MKKQTELAIKAHVIRVASYLVLLVAGTVMTFFGAEAPRKVSHPAAAGLSFAERVAYQRAIEDVYWRHRIWPKENPNPKPSLDAVMFLGQLEKKVEDYLLNSQAVEDYYKQPLSAEQLQGEMNRMARDTRQPEVLRELFEALGNDPFVIAECLVRPVLTERMTAGLPVRQAKAGLLRCNAVAAATLNYTLPTISDGVTGCIEDTWLATTTTNAPSPRYGHTAVWTGSEMIVWGGTDLSSVLNTGGRYNPTTDSWTATSTTNAPTARSGLTAVWTGVEMIVWGGEVTISLRLNTGGRYNPGTDSWTDTSTTNAPAGREYHTAIWTGSEMIVWGGASVSRRFNTGGRYNPSTDSWTDTSTANAPTPRIQHTAVWSGNDMIIWGGTNTSSGIRTGGRYNPSTDSWTVTSISHAPAARSSHTAVWTGSQMIVWGGFNNPDTFDTGGRYNPTADSWTATSISNAPTGRSSHTAVWTGSEMIVWGGLGQYLNTGGRYNPTVDSWTATSISNAPTGRDHHTAVWTGSEMIVWGGYNGVLTLNTGGRYCAQSGAPTPTPGPITLSAQAKKVGGINTARLKWRGAASANLDVYRDLVVIATTPNDGLYDDSTGTTGHASFTYQVCEAGTSTCSNQVTVNFPP